MKKRNELPLGEISHGTLRLEDLLPEVLSLAGEVELSEEDQRLIDTCEMDYGAWHRAGCRDDDDQDMDVVYEDIVDTLQQYAPPYCYLGMNEGDGASLGVWISNDALEMAMHDEEVYSSDEPCEWASVESDAEYWLWVNDHGNCTLYDRDGDVVWEVV